MPDPSVPIADTLGALDDLVRAGKVREIGCSNFTAEQVDEAAAASVEANGAPFRTLQNEWSLLQRAVEPEVLPACRKHGLAVLPYFPLASGLLTGKYRRGEAPEAGTRLALWGERAAGLLTDDRFDVIERLAAYAATQEHSLLDLAVSWLATHDDVASVIAGATTPDQVAANAAAASWRLTADDLAAVDEITPIKDRG
jgi:aryl-alcohol dehydrogenase-like predicted oxidoreductase